MKFDPMVPIWLQVATALKQEIVTGYLPPGGKMPGGRDLALWPTGSIRTPPPGSIRSWSGTAVCDPAGMGTYVTEDPERIHGLRTELARAATDRNSRKKRKALGLGSPGGSRPNYSGKEERIMLESEECDQGIRRENRGRSCDPVPGGRPCVRHAGAQRQRQNHLDEDGRRPDEAHRGPDAVPGRARERGEPEACGLYVHGALFLFLDDGRGCGEILRGFL